MNRWKIRFGLKTVFALVTAGCVAAAYSASLRAVQEKRDAYAYRVEGFDIGQEQAEDLCTASLALLHAEEAMIWPLRDVRRAAASHLERMALMERKMIAMELVGLYNDPSVPDPALLTFRHHRQQAEQMLQRLEQAEK